MNSTVPGQLLRRCRRGTKELDLLLQHWLTSSYPLATEAERARFEAFLALPDPEIARYLLGHEPPADSSFTPLIAQLARSQA